MSTRDIQNGLEDAVFGAIERLGCFFKPWGRVSRSHSRQDLSENGSFNKHGASQPDAPSSIQTRESDDTYITTTSEVVKLKRNQEPQDTNHRRDPVVTEYSCEFVKAFDGEKQCDALLLNNWAMGILQERRKLHETRYRLQDKVGALGGRTQIATPRSEAIEDNCQAAAAALSSVSVICPKYVTSSGEERRSRTGSGLSQHRERLRQIEREIQRCDARLFEHLDGALRSGGFRSPELSEAESTEEQPAPRQSHSGYGPPDSDSSVSTRTRQCRKADLTLDAAIEELDDAEARMRGRHSLYFEQRQAWKQARANDETSITSSRFDQWYFQMVQGMTRDVRDAENKLKEAKRVSRELGMLNTDPDFGFEAFSQASYGYSASVEEGMVNHAPVAKIEAWRAGMEEGNARGYQEALDAMGSDVKNDIEMAARDVDDWAAGIPSIRCGSSIGVLDDGPNREWIDLWREKCGRNGR